MAALSQTTERHFDTLPAYYQLANYSKSYTYALRDSGQVSRDFKAPGPEISKILYTGESAMSAS